MTARILVVDAVEANVAAAFPGAEILIHIDPVGHSDGGLQSTGGQHGRLHLARRISQLGKHLRQQPGKARQPGCGRFRIIQTNGSP